MQPLDIVIHCGGMPFTGRTVAENLGTLGGSESAAYYLARALHEQAGHNVTVFTAAPDPDVCEGVRYEPMGTPTEDAPLGDRFTFYATNTPHDVLIVQRNPGAFSGPRFASKVNLLWLHDIPSAAHRAMLTAGLWQLDGILCVSEYHKNLVMSAYGVPADRVHVLRNGVDLDAVANAGKQPVWNKRLAYISRPERGLDRALEIMQHLPEYELVVCTYDNPAPQLAEFYAEMRARIDAAHNVTWLGHLTKPELYATLHQCGAGLLYPTPSPRFQDFREVSCIAVMEAVACGCPVFTSDLGALPETLAGCDAVLHVNAVCTPEDWANSIRENASAAQNVRPYDVSGMDWEYRANELGDILTTITGTRDTASAVRGYIRHSAISVVKDNGGDLLPAREDCTPLDHRNARELAECYEFYGRASYADHYADYYDYERDRGANYGPEDMTGNPRFELVASLLADLPDGSTVLDYGCAHGHYTVNLALRFPGLRFVGVDIAPSNVYKARAWAVEAGVSDRVEFRVGSVGATQYPRELCDHSGDGVWTRPHYEADAAIMAEVLEHAPNPFAVVSGVHRQVKAGGRIIITTPFGPWEAMGYAEHWPWRAHVHDFTPAVIRDMFGDMADFRLTCLPTGATDRGEPLGSYVYSYTMLSQTCPHIDSATPSLAFPRDVLAEYAAEQTVSMAMIVRDDWQNLAQCLRSVGDLPAELVIGLDEQTLPHNADTIIELAVSWGRDMRIPVMVSRIPSPTVTGFDAARNAVVAECSGVWVMWLDVDERIAHPERLRQYLRPSMLDALVIPQHHMSADPAGLLTTDLPSKVFRRQAGIEFRGRVHEHPEKSLNGGCGPVFVVPGVSIIHTGYDDESTRRARFLRNFPLLERDRKDYPGRHLGAYFWLRDMAQMCQFMIEQNGHVTHRDRFSHWLQSGLLVWQEVLDTRNLRLIVDASKFYRALVEVSGLPSVLVRMSVQVEGAGNSHGCEVEVPFIRREDALHFAHLLVDLQLSGG